MTSGRSGRGQGRPEDLRLPWGSSERAVPRRLVQPIARFLHTEAAGGLLLLVAAMVALGWANSSWADSYDRVWHSVLTVRLGDWAVAEDLRAWVNDALMTLFFLVVGVEIKRELSVGELRVPRVAALPVFAALGGMLIPALVYLAVNRSGVEARGWAIPMATDIAFAVGIVGLLGRRLPDNLRVFLLALAIVDDIGAIIVIAAVYSEGIDFGLLGVAVLLVLLILLLQRIGVRALAPYLATGTALWAVTFASGVHPTIAGVALGLLTPVVPFQPPAGVSSEARRIADETIDDPQPPDADAPLWLSLSTLAKEATPPSARLETLLHPWTSYVILPVFALANAGVHVSEALHGGASSVALGVGLGLVLGKGAGILGASALACRVGLARLPDGVRWPMVAGVAVVAGVGFTVALFVADLAFEVPSLLAEAKLGVLAGSLLAGAVGSGLLMAVRGRRVAGPSD